MAVAGTRITSSTHTRIALAVATACVGPAALAQAALPPGVGVYLENAVVGIGDSNYASSNSVTIYSGGGLQVNGPSMGDTYGLTSAPTMPLGLTTATLSSIGSNVPAGYHATGTASATADLAGGVLRGSTGSVANVPYQPVGPVSARVITASFMQDFLTFAVAGTDGADVTVTAHLDGSYAMSDPYYGGGNVRMVLNLGGSFSYYGSDNAAGNTNGYNGAVLGDFTRYSFSNETPTGFDFTGTLHVTDGERIQTSAGLYLDCAYSACDFGNTARIGLTVPTGVSYTSDSGVFLTATGGTVPPVTAVPEPGTWALMLAGFATLGSVTRRRR
ncbi:MAG: PEPxxWA-CTERM sorting domain-containing protein [Actinomycetota bacterium]|nr:PEPxxWA-CTERM sorting domain-containing protein [Actinomycetota bacterium]